MCTNYTYHKALRIGLVFMLHWNEQWELFTRNNVQSWLNIDIKYDL